MINVLKWLILRFRCQGILQVKYAIRLCNNGISKSKKYNLLTNNWITQPKYNCITEINPGRPTILSTTDSIIGLKYECRDSNVVSDRLPNLPKNYTAFG